MHDCESLRSAADGLTPQELHALLCQEQEPAALLAAAEATLAVRDASLPGTDTETALRRFRRDYLPTAALDPDAPEPRLRGRLMRILPLASILALALAMLVYAGQQRSTRATTTAITRQGTEASVALIPTDGRIPAFSIALPKRFDLEDATSDGDRETVHYRDMTDETRTLSITFEAGRTVSYAPDYAENAEELPLRGFDTPAWFSMHGDDIQIAVTDAAHSDFIYLIVIETHGLSREEAVAAADSLHILTGEEAAP